MTNNITFTLANPVTPRDALLDLNLEYMARVAAGIEQSFGLTSTALLGMELADYVASVIDKVCVDPPPRGAFYVVHVDGALAGMGGLRPLAQGVCEVKRIYVRPAYRGLHLGQSILQRLHGYGRALAISACAWTRHRSCSQHNAFTPLQGLWIAVRMRGRKCLLCCMRGGGLWSGRWSCA